MSEKVLLVFSTFPDAETARRIAEQVVSGQFAACANIIPQVESIYRWAGKLETAKETLVLFKTTADRFPAFEKKLRALHPYEVPEIVAVDVTHGSSPYLAWVAENCASDNKVA